MNESTSQGLFVLAGKDSESHYAKLGCRHSGTKSAALRPQCDLRASQPLPRRRSAVRVCTGPPSYVAATRICGRAILMHRADIFPDKYICRRQEKRTIVCLKYSMSCVFERRARNIPFAGIASRLLAIYCTLFSGSAMAKVPHCLDCGDCR